MWIDDEVIRHCSDQSFVTVWQPDQSIVVLGRSNQAEQEVYVERCHAAAVPILKRYGGGGTVLLYPGCMVLSCGAWVSSPYDNDRYFSKLNGSVMRTIERRLPGLDLAQKGYSDIVVGSQKIAGTSLFRSRQYLLYQASLLFDLDISSIETYLKHPSREPEYRAARSHRDFLAGLCEFVRDPADRLIGPWLDHFLQHWPQDVQTSLQDDLVEPMEKHIPHLLKRAGLLPP